MEESSRFEGLREEIGIVVYGGNKRNYETALFNKFTNKVMSSIDVLCAGVIFWVIGRVNRGLVVKRQAHWFLVRLEPKLLVQPVEVYILLL